MLQDYRYARPHEADTCPTGACAPGGQGHALCMAPGCDQIATFQTRRHATQAEYDELPEAWKPIDGIAHRAVYACDDDEHAEATAPFCEHAQPKPPECPDCPAGVDEPCVKADGTERKVPHFARTQQPGVYDRCLHAHREDCPIFDGCQCSSDDAPPEREPRIQPEPDHADGSRSKLPPEIVRQIVEAYDIPWWTVRHYATVTAQDQTPALDVTFATLDQDANIVQDEHGHDVLDAVRIPLDPTGPRAPEQIPIPAYVEAG